MTYRRLPVAVVAACLTAGLATAPSALAADGGAGQAKAKSSQSARTLNTRLNQTRTSLRKLTRDLGALSRRLQTTEGGTRLLLSAAPQLVNGLTTLASAVQTQIVPNLTRLGAAVQNDIAPGLTRLGAAYGSVEYGRAGIFAVGTSNPLVAAGGRVTSADIPDDGNQVTVNETAIVVAQATGSLALDLKAAIRSAESDGVAGEKVGQAGGFVFVKNADTGSRVPCTGAPNPPGILGTTTGESIWTPDGFVTNQPLKNLMGGIARTDTAAPTADSTSLLPAQCGFGATIGDVYEVVYSVNFVDIPTSRTPGPTE
jgi:hypothetical protein